MPIRRLDRPWLSDRRARIGLALPNRLNVASCRIQTPERALCWAQDSGDSGEIDVTVSGGVNGASVRTESVKVWGVWTLARFGKRLVILGL
jgi:hypothetical protein